MATVRQLERNKRALSRLENQLKSKKKTEKKTYNKVDLTDKDIQRIEKEIEVLKSRT